MFFLTKILPYINKAPFVKSDFREEKSIVIVFSQNEKNECLKFAKNVTTFNEFSYGLLQKKYPTIKSLSDIKSIAILETICKETCKDFSLKKLVSIPSFLAQILDLINRLKNEKISVEVIRKICESGVVPSLDKKRLEELLNVWEKYDLFMKRNNYTDSANHLSLLMSRGDLFDDFMYENVYVILPNELNSLQEQFFVNLSKTRNVMLYGLNEKLEKLADRIVEPMIDFVGEIAQRSCFLLGDNVLLEHSEKIKYCELLDENNEFEMIASYINQKIKVTNCNFSDFTIVVSNFEKKQKIANFMCFKEIPVNFQGPNLSQKNFAIKLERYIEICKIIKKSGLKKFSLAELTKLKSCSKSMAQYYIEQLNLYFENIISETFEDIYLKDRLVSSSSEDFCILNVVETNIDLLKETDKIAFYEQIELLSAMYKAFNEQRFFDFVNILYSKSKNDDKTFGVFYKRFSAQVASLQQLLTNGEITEINPKFILEICNRIFEENERAENCVEILNLAQAKGRSFKNLIVSYFDESLLNKKDSYIYFISPGANELVSNEVLNISSGFSKIIEDDKGQTPINELLAGLFINTTDSVLVTKFEQDGIFEYFEKLVNADNKNIIEFVSTVADDQGDFIESKKEADENVFSLEETIILSGSSITSFQKCPRKYFYKNILNIEEESTFRANYGTIVHNVLELFCKKHLNNFTKKKILELAEILFNSGSDLQKAIDEGFDELSIALVANTSALALYEMRQNFYSAVEELEKNGYFNNIPQKVCTEVNFKFNSKELNNIALDGRIDAIVKFDDGSYKILDYKTGKDVVKNLYDSLSEKSLDFENFPQKANEYNYQLPIYYFAIQEAGELSEYKDKISGIGYLYVRPKTLGGYKEDVVDTEIIEDVKDTLIKNLQTTIVDKIRAVKTFATNPSVFNCDKCPYKFACEVNEEELEEE